MIPENVLVAVASVCGTLAFVAVAAVCYQARKRDALRIGVVVPEAVEVVEVGNT